MISKLIKNHPIYAVITVVLCTTFLTAAGSYALYQSHKKPVIVPVKQASSTTSAESEPAAEPTPVVQPAQTTPPPSTQKTQSTPSIDCAALNRSSQSILNQSTASAYDNYLAQKALIASDTSLDEASKSSQTDYKYYLYTLSIQNNKDSYSERIVGAGCKSTLSIQTSPK